MQVQTMTSFLTWPEVQDPDGNSLAASNVKFSVSGTNLNNDNGQYTIDQRIAPRGEVSSDQLWQQLATVLGDDEMTSITVTMTVDSEVDDGLAFADAVRIEESSQLEDEPYNFEGSVFHDLNGNGIWDRETFSLDATHLVFAIDVSQWSRNSANISGIGSILDAQIAGVSALAGYIRARQVAGGLQDTKISVIPYANANTDDHPNNTSAIDWIEESTEELFFQAASVLNQDLDFEVEFEITELVARGGVANYEGALQEIIDIVDAEIPGQPDPGELEIVFLSGGEDDFTPDCFDDYGGYAPTVAGGGCASSASTAPVGSSEIWNPGEFQDEVASLLYDYNANIHAVGIGPEVNMSVLRQLDPNAQRMTSVNQFLSLFNIQPGVSFVAEPPIEDWLVYLDANEDGVRNNSEAFTYTDENGFYSFIDVDDTSRHALTGEDRSEYYYSVALDGVYDAPILAQNGVDPIEYQYDFGVGMFEEIAVNGITGTKYEDVNVNGVRDLNGLVTGDLPEVIFVIDVSGSTSIGFIGSDSDNPIGNQNGDDRFNTVLDGEIAAFRALNQSLIERGVGDTARIGIVTFNGAVVSTWNFNTPNGVESSGLWNQLQSGGSTSFPNALDAAITMFGGIGSTAPEGFTRNLIFLSDGNGTSAVDQADDLRDMGVHIRAFGAGAAANLPFLEEIDGHDPDNGDETMAERFTDPTALIDVFAGNAVDGQQVFGETRHPRMDNPTVPRRKPRRRGRR